MFDFFKKEKFLTAVADGQVIDITKVSDQVFSQKILGDGFAVIPENGEISSPASGIVTDVTETLHAYCITSDDGLEILVHIGIDTVELKGTGFTPLVKKGDRINQGDSLAKADLELLKNKGYSTATVVVITNTESLKSYSALENPNANSGDKAFIYKI
ncbi:MAG: PTS glucose transporter subunit IIA [Ruminococcaceae bacterium]|nr:PTS glucose transporter subunit IIA [Oscillospiraceae bacterium]